MTEENTLVHVGDDEVSLMDIAGIDLAEVAEYRQTVTPAGKFLWRIVEAKIEARDVTNKEDPTGPKIAKPAVNFELEAQNCYALVNDKLDPASFIGTKHFETTYITDVGKDLGRIKAFLVDIGLAGAGSLTDLLAEAQGVEFVGDITNNKDKNNPDIIYANLKKPMTVDAFNATQADSEAA